MPNLPFVGFDMFQRMRLRRWASALLAPVCALAMLGAAQASERDDDKRSDDSYAIGLWGDLPYSPGSRWWACPT